MDGHKLLEVETLSNSTPQTPSDRPSIQASLATGSDDQTTGETAAYVVGIGASAGGLEMIEQFFSHTPPDSGLAFVVVTHLHPEHPSILPELLSYYTRMPVLPGQHGALVRPNTVYVIRPGYALTITKKRLYLEELAQPRSKRHTIDHFLFSLAADCGAQAVAVILSGAGNDGAAGVAAVKAAGGTVVVQDSATARYADMPQSAIDTGLIDIVTAVPSMSARILEHIGIGAYARAHHQAEGAGQARFFRDNDTLELLCQALPKLIANHTPPTPIRVWVVGCATGEEAYTIAIMLSEHLRINNLSVALQVFASDDNEQVISQARRGSYQHTVIADIKPEYLERYFIKNKGDNKIAKTLRDEIIFAKHDLFSDPPFSRLDLIVCRNTLRFKQNDQQARLLSLFFQALCPDGLLLLDAADPLGVGQSFFRPLDEFSRLLQRRDAPHQSLLALSSRAPTPAPTSHSSLTQRGQQPTHTSALAERLLLLRYSPPSIVVDELYQAVYFSTRISHVLEYPEGEPTHNILRMVRKELQTVLHTAIHAAISQQKTIRYQGLKIHTERGNELIDLRVEPIAMLSSTRRLALVIFERHRSTPQDSLRRPRRVRPSPRVLTKNRLIRQLEQQLYLTHTQLQHTIEDLERSNRELNVTNQDLMSINEEFQMTNEELESSREELHFLNEELISLNTKLQNNVDELVQFNDDMHNLFSSSRVATLFLDRSLRVQRFTPAMIDIVPLIEEDVGRPFQDVSATFEYADFARDAARVLTEACTLEREIVSGDRHYSMRLHPYQTASGITGGVVITFFDTTSLKRAEAALHQSQKMQALGTLAGGIAHDFNNILTAILGNVEFGKTDLPADHEVQQNFSEIERAALRASDLVRRILTFSRKREADRQAIELQPLVEEALKLLRATLPAMIDIRTDFAAALPKVLADTTQLHQVIMNIGANGAHAIGASGGTLTITLEHVMVGAALVSHVADLHEGPYVCLSVRDTGHGIDKATIERIFDPFFTTKLPGEGTGLGLSVVHGIMKAHDGAIVVDSAPGHGSEFQLYFPVAAAAAAPEPAPAYELARGRGQHILCIDDEMPVLRYLTRLLEKLGYHPTGFTDPVVGLQYFREQPYGFDAVVTDYSMPGLSGLDLVDQLSAIRPSMPVVLVSGYIQPHHFEEMQRSEFFEVLAKPYNSARLAQVLQRILPKQREVS